MQTLSTVDLANVTGGKDVPTSTGTGGGGGGGGGNDALLTMLQGIQSSLKDLGKNQNQGLFGGQSGMLFMTMALAMSQRAQQQQVVVVGGGCRRGGCWRSW